MEKQKPEHISKFKKGDIITRLENYEFFSQLDDISGKIEMVPVVSSVYTGIGIPYEFIGVLNGKILVNYAQDMPIHSTKKGENCDFYDYTKFQNGWAKYVDPKTLREPKERMLNKEDAQGFLENIITNYSN